MWWFLSILSNSGLRSGKFSFFAYLSSSSPFLCSFALLSGKFPSTFSDSPSVEFKFLHMLVFQEPRSCFLKVPFLFRSYVSKDINGINSWKFFSCLGCFLLSSFSVLISVIQIGDSSPSWEIGCLFNE